MAHSSNASRLPAANNSSSWVFLTACSCTSQVHKPGSQTQPHAQTALAARSGTPCECCLSACPRARLHMKQLESRHQLHTTQTCAQRCLDSRPPKRPHRLCSEQLMHQHVVWMHDLVRTCSRATTTLATPGMMARGFSEFQNSLHSAFTVSIGKVGVLASSTTARASKSALRANSKCPDSIKDRFRKA